MIGRRGKRDGDIDGGGGGDGGGEDEENSIADDSMAGTAVKEKGGSQQVVENRSMGNRENEEQQQQQQQQGGANAVQEGSVTAAAMDYRGEEGGSRQGVVVRREAHSFDVRKADDEGRSATVAVESRSAADGRTPRKDQHSNGKGEEGHEGGEGLEEGGSVETRRFVETNDGKQVAINLALQKVLVSFLLQWVQ